MNLEDDLEKFVQENELEFNEEIPSTLVWEKLENELNLKTKVKVVPLNKVLQYGSAAAVILFFGTYMFFSQTSKTVLLAETETSPTEILDFSLGDLSPELKEIEDYYVSQVNFKLEELSHLEIDSSLVLEIELLNTEFEELKKEMGNAINEDKVVEAMISNYRLRLEVLKVIQENINESNITENEESSIHFI